MTPIHPPQSWVSFKNYFPYPLDRTNTTTTAPVQDKKNHKKSRDGSCVRASPCPTCETLGKSLTSLCLSFFREKMGIIIVVTSQGCGEFISMQRIKQCWAHGEGDEYFNFWIVNWESIQSHARWHRWGKWGPARHSDLPGNTQPAVAEPRDPRSPRSLSSASSPTLRLTPYEVEKLDMGNIFDVSFSDFVSKKHVPPISTMGTMKPRHPWSMWQPRACALDAPAAGSLKVWPCKHHLWNGHWETGQ